MSLDIPETDRVIRVENADLLHDQREYSEKQMETEDTENGREYHRIRIDETSDIIEEIEDDGVSEVDIRSRHQTLAEEVGEIEEENMETIPKFARHDALAQAIREYFGGFDSDVIEMGEVVASSVFQSGEVQLTGMNRRVVLDVGHEENARATADTILRGVGLSLEEETQRSEPMF